MPESLTFILLFLVYLAGGYGLFFTTIDAVEMSDYLSAAPNLTLRVLEILENTYLFLYGAAAVEIIFVLFGTLGLIPAWSKTIDSHWVIMIAYGVLFLVSAAYMADGVARAYRAAVSPIVGYTPHATQLRDIINKLFVAMRTGLELWVFAGALFLLLPPIKRAIRKGKDQHM